MSEKFPKDFENCQNFLNHKTFNMHPLLVAKILEELGHKLYCVIQHPFEIMLIGPGHIHFGVNFLINCSYAANFIDKSKQSFEIYKNSLCCNDKSGQDVYNGLNSVLKSKTGPHLSRLVSHKHNAEIKNFVYENPSYMDCNIFLLNNYDSTALSYGHFTQAREQGIKMIGEEKNELSMTISTPYFNETNYKILKKIISSKCKQKQLVILK